MDSFITWNCPVSTAMWYRKIEATIIQAMRNIPNVIPRSEAFEISNSGIWNTRAANRPAMIRPQSAETQTRFLRTSKTKKSVSTAKAESNVESGQKGRGSKF